MTKSSRRDFLKSVGAASGATMAYPLLGSLLAMNEAAASVNTTDYKALVCVFLAGGNDAYNTLVYNDQESRPVYLEKRRTVKVDQVLPLEGTTFALNANLTYLSGLFNANNSRMAIVANVGPIKDGANNTQDKEALATNNWPSRLFSHNDQTSTWLTGNLEGKGQGWGGGLVASNTAALASANTAAAFQSVSMDAASAFGTKATVKVFAASSTSGMTKPASFYWDETVPALGGYAGLAFPAANYLEAVMQGKVGMTRIASGFTLVDHVMEREYVNKMSNALAVHKYLREPGAGKLTLTSDDGVHKPLYAQVAADGQDDSNNMLWRQLAMVAEFIRSSKEIGVRRQVFYVQLGGFDTHSGQTAGNSVHDGLLKTLDRALERFDKVLGQTSGLQDCVTTFTASEFGRKLIENGDGTDHGWGGHHFVIGGSKVNGGKIYGRPPSLVKSTTGSGFADPQLLSDGTMIPEVSVDHFGWQLAQWFGVPVAKRAEVFPGYFAPPTTYRYSNQPYDISFMST